MNGAHAERVYFEQLKRTVPLSAVLEYYGVLSELKRVGREFRGRCPLHKGSNPKQFVVNLEKGVWHCFSPHHDTGGGILEFVAEFEHVDVKQAAHRIADAFCVKPAGYLQQKQRRKRVSGQPSHKAFVVEDRGEGDDKDAFWTRVGSAWPHGDGKGLNIQIAPGVAVSGRLVLREFTSEDAEEEKKPNGGKRKKA